MTLLRGSNPPSPDNIIRLLIPCYLNAVPQALNDELFACDATVNIPHIVGGALEVAAGVVALGDEGTVVGAVVDGLVNGDRGTLDW